MKTKLIALLAFFATSIHIQAQSPCVDIGFEGLSTGPLVSSAWTSLVNTTAAGACNANSSNFSNSNIKAIVVSTPTLDAVLGTIPNSPFAGTKALQLFYGYSFGMAKISKTFTITNANFIYQYAYMGALQTGGHSYCDASALQFRFFDCNNNPLSTISRTIGTTNPDAAYWTGSTAGTSVTPNWVVHQVNLSAYIGLCVRVEVVASSCNFGGHYGYCYYDDQCSSSFLEVNGDAIVASPSYTSCSNTATLSAEGVFSSYLWQGPPASGISGSTLAVVTTSVPGSYTLTVNTGTNTFSQSVQLTINNLTPPVLSGNLNICPSQSATLQLTGQGLTSYSWSSGATGSVIVVSPPVTTDYTVNYNNIYNCSGTKTLTVVRQYNPQVVFTTPADYVCEGSSVVMNLSNPVGLSALWSSGANTSSASVSPTLTTVYTVTVTTQAGCSSSATHTVFVWPKPQLSVSGNNAICFGASALLQASGANTYTWNTGSTATQVSFTPAVTTVYTVTGKDLNGCVNSTTTSIVVNPLPVVQNGNNSSTVCLGSSVSIWAIAQGGTTYQWSNGASNQTIVVSPSSNSVYNVTVTNASGCKASASQTVQVLPVPTIQLGASNDIICEGESVDITSIGSGAIAYQWSNGATAASISVTPNQTTTYTLTGTATNGCSGMAAITVTVNECVGLVNRTLSQTSIRIFPNPSQGHITITSDAAYSLELFDATGRLLRTTELNEINSFTQNFDQLSKGIYFVRAGLTFSKVIVE